MTPPRPDIVEEAEALDMDATPPALAAEVKTLRAALGAAGRLLGQVCVAATIQPGERLTEPSEHAAVAAILSVVDRWHKALAEADALRAALLPEEPTDEMVEDLAEHLWDGMLEQAKAEFYRQTWPPYIRAKHSSLSEIQLAVANARFDARRALRHLAKRPTVAPGFASSLEMLQSLLARAKRENDELRARVAALEPALNEALVEWEYAAQYKGEFLSKKHGDAEDIARLRKLLPEATTTLADP